MEPGLLRHRVTIERPEELDAGAGSVQTAWLPVATVFASVEPLRGREFSDGRAVLADMDTRIRVRWAPGLDGMSEKWRLLHEGRIFNPYSVAHVGYGRELIEIMAKAGPSEG
jgi:SPP1 family predicted phage head-tail adaptor